MFSEQGVIYAGRHERWKVVSQFVYPAIAPDYHMTKEIHALGAPLRRFLARAVAGIGLVLLPAAAHSQGLPAVRADADLRAAQGTQILLFTGKGVSPSDVKAIESLMNRARHAYATADSAQLNGMTPAQLSSYRLLIVPGGDFVTMGNGLTEETTEKVRNAVGAGLNYLGICAGGFLAGSFPRPYKSFNLSSGVKFGFYSASAQGFRKAVVRITTSDGQSLDQYWEDGPQFSGWGEVSGRYPDGTPAIVHGHYGSGRVVLTGVHPEAPESWRKGMTFATPTSTSHEYAMKLIDRALTGK